MTGRCLFINGYVTMITFQVTTFYLQTKTQTKPKHKVNISDFVGLEKFIATTLICKEGTIASSQHNKELEIAPTVLLSPFTNNWKQTTFQGIRNSTRCFVESVYEIKC